MSVVNETTTSPNSRAPSNNSTSPSTTSNDQTSSANSNNASSFTNSTRLVSLPEETTRLEMTTSSIFTTDEAASRLTVSQSTVEHLPSEICYSRTTLFIVSGVSGGVVLLVLLLSLVCFLRLRYKWRAKLSLERERTDIWSMRTFNNTIVNDNFMDYQLAAPTTFSYKSSAKNRRKSSGLSEHSVRIVDPYSRRSSRNNASVENIADLRRASSGNRKSYEAQYTFDDSTLRRNTYSAPGGLDAPIVPVAQHQHTDQLPSNRERAVTFSAGKKHKMDKHVLLTHEEFVEDDRIQEFAGSMPTNSYIVTEL